MALSKCKECGRQVSSAAKRCPNCGVSQSSATGGIFLIVIVAFGIYGLWNWLSPEKPVVSPEKPVVHIYSMQECYKRYPKDDVKKDECIDLWDKDRRSKTTTSPTTSASGYEPPKIPIEPGATIDRLAEPMHRSARVMARLAKLQGYRCDSISSAMPFILSEGFTLRCNNFRYNYEIEDVGGTWRVTPK